MCVLRDELVRADEMSMEVPASSFYRYKEGWSTCTGIRSRRLHLESGVSSGRLLLEVHCCALESVAPGVAVILGTSLALRGSRQRPGDSCGRHGGCC